MTLAANSLGSPSGSDLVYPAAKSPTIDHVDSNKQVNEVTGGWPMEMVSESNLFGPWMVVDGSRVNLAHEEVAAVPRVENGESAKQGLKSGDHMAVSIIEHELNGNPRDIHDGQRGKIVSGKGKIDVSRNNVQIHRNSGL
ncbi:hypothetical protein V6N12_014081 [Hibiscus sabdariffa]|uniref:Uncharacterized protein n=1 Tax=Hibiscus sabdariffa TaxID=183260 RepID=A0ABR2CXU5_9ROSI